MASSPSPTSRSRSRPRDAQHRVERAAEEAVDAGRRDATLDPAIGGDRRRRRVRADAVDREAAVVDRDHASRPLPASRAIAPTHADRGRDSAPTTRRSSRATTSAVRSRVERAVVGPRVGRGAGDEPATVRSLDGLVDAHATASSELGEGGGRLDLREVADAGDHDDRRRAADRRPARAASWRIAGDRSPTVITHRHRAVAVRVGRRLEARRTAGTSARDQARPGASTAARPSGPSASQPPGRRARSTNSTAPARRPSASSRPAASRAAPARIPSCKVGSGRPMSGSCSTAADDRRPGGGSAATTPSVAPPLTPTHDAARSLLVGADDRRSMMRSTWRRGRGRRRVESTAWSLAVPRAHDAGAPADRSRRALPACRRTTPVRPRRRARARRRGRSSESADERMSAVSVADGL